MKGYDILSFYFLFMKYFISSNKKKELQQKLKELTQKKAKVLEKLRESFGNFWKLGTLENEYQDLREEVERIENEISKINYILKNAEIIKKKKTFKKVEIGCKVSLKSKNKIIKLSIVGTLEADPLHGKISNESPLGKLLLGKKVGDKINLKKGNSSQVFEILEIKPN